MPHTNNVTRMLAAKGVAFDAHELPKEKLGGMEAAEFLGVEPAAMFKTIVALREDGGKPVLAVVPANAEVDLKALGKALGTKKLGPARQAQAEQLTGLQSGGISPLALIDRGFEVVVDESALELGTIYVSGGQRGLNLSLAPGDLIAFTRARTAAIAR
jgi:Cys-tRNA(Pro)/Cys-tRNA(Cys) deacylase